MYVMFLVLLISSTFANEAAVSAMKSCNADARNPSSACPGDSMCTCKDVEVGGGQLQPRCFCATPVLASEEATVGFSGDDANIWGAIEGEFSEKGEETGPVTPDASHHYLPGGASCRTHGQCKSGFCRRGTCTADDDDWRNQEIAVSSGSNGTPTITAYYLANWNKNSCAWATGVQVMDEKECLSGINSLGWGITKLGWTGSSGSVPKGCSFDPKSKKGHFNSHPTGHGRQDLRPLCKSKNYDDKCGGMYAYCEGKYGVGKTNNCCEFYRGSSQMNSLAVTRETGSISSHTAVVYSFAALGFGFLIFGAAKHYLGSKTDKESMPFNEL